MLSYRDSPPKSPTPPPANPSGVGGLTWEAWNRSAVRRYIKLRAHPEPYLTNPTLTVTLTLTPALLCPPPHHHPSPDVRYNKLHQRREDERYCDELPCAVPDPAWLAPRTDVGADGLSARRLGAATVDI